MQPESLCAGMDFAIAIDVPTIARYPLRDLSSQTNVHGDNNAELNEFVTLVELKGTCLTSFAIALTYERPCRGYVGFYFVKAIARHFQCPLNTIDHAKVLD